MRVFAYEYLCATTLEGSPALAALRAEGAAMLGAVLEDLGRCPGVHALTLLDPSVPRPPGGWPAHVRVHSVVPDAEDEVFGELARTADFTLVIAPECAGLLAGRCRRVEEEGGRLLGPSAAAVRRTGDKLGLARHLLERGVPTPASVPLSEVAGAGLPFPFPVVCKPRDGAGAQATFLVRDEGELMRCESRARAEGWAGELIVQPHVPGRPVSVALLQGRAGRFPLPAAAQTLSADGRFHYLGGSVPLPGELDRRARALAVRAAEAVAGLHGYFGVDLVLGDRADGSGDAVIEINPRVTTSYVGLRALAGGNLMGALLDVVRGTTPAWSWRAGTVRFRADGVLST